MTGSEVSPKPISALAAQTHTPEARELSNLKRAAITGSEVSPNLPRASAALERTTASRECSSSRRVGITLIVSFQISVHRLCEPLLS